MIGGASVTIRPDRAAQARLVNDPDSPAGRAFARKLNQITTGAKRRANVDTGLMRSRIEYRLLDGSPLTGEVVAATNYARWVHDGTRHYAGNPFLTDAAREVSGITTS